MNFHLSIRAKCTGIWHSNLPNMKPIWMDVLLVSACELDIARSPSGCGLRYLDKSMQKVISLDHSRNECKACSKLTQGYIIQ